MDKERVGQGPTGPVSAEQVRATVQVIKWWLGALTVLILGLCVVYVAHSLKIQGRSASPATQIAPPEYTNEDGAWVGKVSTSVDGKKIVEGPWGRLKIVPITLSAPMERLKNALPTKARDMVWYFRCADLAELYDLLSEADLPESIRETLMSRAKPLPKEVGGYWTRPGQELILGLDPDTRAKLYRLLHDDTRNVGQRRAFRFFGASVDQWFRDSGISPATAKLVTPMIYRQGRVLLFADALTVWPMLPTDAERMRLLDTLTRMPTMRLRLELPPHSDVESLANYWGRGGRTRHVRQILAAAQRRGDPDIDISELLPPFAEQRIYAYPTLQMVRSQVLHDCHWTALNFFAEQPDDRFGRPGQAFKTFDADYREVSGRPQFGDLVMYYGQDGKRLHSAVYIASNILFTKNGSGVTPWMLLESDYMKDCYPQSKTLTMRYFRRR